MWLYIVWFHVKMLEFNPFYEENEKYIILITNSEINYERNLITIKFIK